MKYIKPIIKWVGGKTQIIDKIIELIPIEIENYHELFIGGGSVLLAVIENINNKNIKLNGNLYAYDYNETLINMYKNIQTKPKKLYKEISKLINIYNNIKSEIINRKPNNIKQGLTSQESFYYWIRLQYNLLTQKEKNTILGSSYFIFLNKTCFRGLYRESINGFNVPFGHYKNPEIINEEHLLQYSKLIKNVFFLHSSFEQSFENINTDDFVYLDPPYAPENDKSFVGYNKDGFDINKHKLLFSLCKKYNFLMSNASVKLVKDSFKNKKYKIYTIECKRNINSVKPNSTTNEVLITLR